MHLLLCEKCKADFRCHVNKFIFENSRKCLLKENNFLSSKKNPMSKDNKPASTTKPTTTNSVYITLSDETPPKGKTKK
jgi:hypothetical protein